VIRRGVATVARPKHKAEVAWAQPPAAPNRHADQMIQKSAACRAGWPVTVANCTAAVAPVPSAS
jgi:hypothetical protein